MKYKKIKKNQMMTEDFIHYLRIRVNSTGESLLKRTAVIKEYRYFPKNSNQCRKIFVCYTKYGYILDAVESIGISCASLRAQLPKRITVLNYDFYTTAREFRYYTEFSMNW